MEPVVSKKKSIKWPEKVAIIWMIAVVFLMIMWSLFPDIRQYIVNVIFVITAVMSICLNKSEIKFNRVIGKSVFLISLIFCVVTILSLTPVEHPYRVDFPGGTRAVDKSDVQMEYKIDEHFYIVSVGHKDVRTKWDEFLVTFWGAGYKDRIYHMQSENEQKYEEQLQSVSTNESYIKPILAVMNELKQKPIFEEIAIVNAPNGVENFLQNGDRIIAINGEKNVPNIVYLAMNPKTILGDEVTVTIQGKQEMKMTKQIFIEKLTKDNIQVRSEFPNLDLNVLPAKVIVSDGSKGDSSSVSRALEVYQQLTGENLVKGRKIAATGGIQSDGRITPIGGLYYKYHGLVDQGFDVFVIPKIHRESVENGLESGLIPKDMKLIYADTLTEAIEQLRK